MIWLKYCLKVIMGKTALHLESPWRYVKELLKEVNSELTDDDLQYEPGKENELLQRLSKKMGRDADHIKGWIESVSANKRPAS